MKFVLLFVFSFGCAHYSLVAPASKTVVVPSFSIEAQTDLNGTDLAMTLVQGLEGFGVLARFGSAKTGEERIDCHVINDSVHADSTSFVRTKVLCRKGEVEFSEFITIGANHSANLDKSSVLVQSAATESVEKLSIEISRYLLSERER